MTTQPPKRNNEFTIAASYYEIFSRSRQTSTKTSDNDQKEATPSTPTSLQQEQQQQDYWTQDIWTESNEELAEQTLQNHLEKCTITRNFVNNQIHEEEEDAIAWDQFYTDHGTKFFKDRHYLEKAFPEEFLVSSEQVQDHHHQQQQSSSSSSSKPKTLVEIGCGVGNAILPLLEEDWDDEGDGDGTNRQQSRRSEWTVIHGLDISQQAITLLQQEPRFISFNERGRKLSQNEQQQAVYGHVCDISKEIPNSCKGISDVTTLLFCLSAIDPSDMIVATQNVISTLKPGGILVFRDYGRYDEAQMKLGISRSKQIKNNFYRKHDGTKCYYFTLDDVSKLFSTDLNIIELKYLRRIYHNKGIGQQRRRVWVQGRFQKPEESSEK
jgi:methyltransferase-like protein 6